MTKHANNGDDVGNAAMLQLLSSLVAAAAGKSGAKLSTKNVELDWTMINEMGSRSDGFVPFNPTTMKPVGTGGIDGMKKNATEGTTMINGMTMMKTMDNSKDSFMANDRTASWLTTVRVR